MDGSFTYIGHPFERKIKQQTDILNDDIIVPVQVGLKDHLPNRLSIQLTQKLSEWKESKDQYLDVYNMFKDSNAINFADPHDKSCPILNTLKNFINSQNDLGFAVKGYNFVDHLRLFKTETFKREVYIDHYFCFLANDNVVLYLTEEKNMGISYAVNSSAQNIQITNMLHKKLSERNVTQINVILYNHQKDDCEKFCSRCVDNELYVNKDVFGDIEKISIWYQKMLDNIVRNNIKKKINPEKYSENPNICEVIKSDMILYEALTNNHFPVLCSHIQKTSESESLLDGVIKTIKKSNFAWICLALSIGIKQEDVIKIKNKRSTIEEFVYTLTNKLWKEIFQHLNLTSVNPKYAEITAINKLVEIFAGNFKQKSSVSSEIDIIYEIATRIPHSIIFGKILGLEESYLRRLMEDFPLYTNRNKEYMRKFAFPFKPSVSWPFWRQYLIQFEDGETAISEIETAYPFLINEVSNQLFHHTVESSFAYVGHPFQHKNKQSADTNIENRTHLVRVGTEDMPIYDIQKLSEWNGTKERYIDIYKMLKDAIVIDFVDIRGKLCPILNTLRNFFNSQNNVGFAVKGYNFVDHLNLFKTGMFKREVYNDQYFCFFANDNVVLYLTEESKAGVSHALHHSTQNIQISNMLHKELQTRNVTQINVILYNHQNDDSEKFCSQCVDNEVYVSKDVFADVYKFSLWYKKMLSKIDWNRKEISDSGKMFTICEQIKKDMITYEALRSNEFPSFSPCKTDQIDELKKLILLTSTQFEILHCNEFHLLLRGSYGSGKTLILLKKLEQVVSDMKNDEICFVICNDQQSQFIYYLKSVIYERYSGANLIVVKSTELVRKDKIPNLSNILHHILNVWDKQTVHIFIDEFSGSFFDKKEVLKLQKVLMGFRNSHIVVGLQSMEEIPVQEYREIDLGYQFELLASKTTFLVKNLDYSLRCSLEINNFVKETSKILENTMFSNTTEYFMSDSLVVDKEQAKDRNHNWKQNIKSSVNYNQHAILGHSVSVCPVKIFYFNQKLSGVVKNTCDIYIEITEHLLEDISEDNKYVLCTYDEYLFNSVYCFFATNFSRCTNSVTKFIEETSEFKLLITDYASIRGYEFPNLIFLLPLRNSYLRYRMIECFTRATTKLTIICDNIASCNDESNVVFDHEIDDSISNDKLIEKWKMLDCVYFVNCKYFKSNRTLYLQHRQEVLEKVLVEKAFERNQTTKYVTSLCHRLMCKQFVQPGFETIQRF